MRRIAHIRIVFAAALAAAALLSAAPARAAIVVCNTDADFNNDGFADLASGVPGEDFGEGDSTVLSAGLVNVLYGSAAGFTAVDDQVWHQSSSGIANLIERDDHFGSALAAGDFNKDTFTDLAIGVPGEDIGGTKDGGAFHVLLGSAAGLTATGSQYWTQNSPGVKGVVRTQDHFGIALAACDFDGDGFFDLAVGAAEADIVGGRSGEVAVLFGSSDGLTASGDELWSQKSAGVPGAGEFGDEFGSVLEAGDFNGDGFADLAIGAPEETLGNAISGGAVTVLNGSSGGLTASGATVLHQSQASVPGKAETSDRFGAALAAGNFDNDGHADLVVGAPGEDLGTIEDAGVAFVFSGGSGGLGPAVQWHQGTTDVIGRPETDDSLGSAVGTGDFNGDGFSDLALGAPGERVGDAFSDAGAVNVLYGSSSGIVATANQFWSQESNAIEGVSETDDRFGAALSAGDADNDGHWELIAGVPEEDVIAAEDSGATAVIYGTQAGLGPINDQLLHQETNGVLGHPERFDTFGSAIA